MHENKIISRPAGDFLSQAVLWVVTGPIADNFLFSDLSSLKRQNDGLVYFMRMLDIWFCLPISNIPADFGRFWCPCWCRIFTDYKYSLSYMESTYYYVYSYCDGPLPDADIQSFFKIQASSYQPVTSTNKCGYIILKPLLANTDNKLPILSFIPNISFKKKHD